MPQFIPQHTPRGLNEFTRGYLDCAEWLLDDEIDRDKISPKGWTRVALKQAQQDCTDFMTKHAADLGIYYDLGRSETDAGHDFWLTRNGHGTGFWDRGDDPVYQRLTDAAHAYGEQDADVHRGRIYLSP